MLRSSLMLSFPLEKPMGRTYLLCLQTLIQRFIHTNEERSSSGTLWTWEIVPDFVRIT